MRIKQILLATVLTVFSLNSFATDYYIAKTFLNVRTGEGTEYAVSFTLQKGEEIKVLSKNNSWYGIEYFGKTGYVNSKYLRFSKAISDIKSDAPKQTVPYFLIGICVSLTFFIVFFLSGNTRNKKLVKTVTGLNRGTETERDLVLKLLKFGMSADIIFHDLYVEKQKGFFSQIDLVAVTDVGIIVFEVKDYSGWLFGRGNQSQWTQVLAYGKQRYRFYNPIMQNNTHLTELRKQLIPYGHLPFYSIVVFYGNCVLKEIDFVPDKTFLVKSERVIDILKIMLKENEQVHYTNKAEVFRVLKEAVANGGITENQIRHAENIKEMLGKHRIFE